MREIVQIIITLPDPLLLSLSKGECDYEPIIQGVQEQVKSFLMKLGSLRG
jgi:hypothetical protein